jgi:hypothetical protein
MAYTLTYPKLRTEIMRIVENDAPEFVEQLPSIIAIAQDAVQRDLDLSIWRTIERDHLRAGSSEYPRKPDWLKVTSLWLPAERTLLERRSLDYIRLFGKPGVPKFWAETDERAIKLAPTPQHNHAVEVEAHKRLPALTDTAPTNWITENCADLLLFACLIGSESFLVGPERMAEFASLYKGALDSARRELRGVDREESTPVRSVAPPRI